MALARTQIATPDDTNVSSLTEAAVTLATGDLLIVKTGIGKAFDAQVVTGITWNSNAMTSAIALKATGTPWFAASIWYYKVTSGGTGDVVITYAGSNAAVAAEIVKYTGHDTTTPIGDTDSVETATNPSVAARILTTTAGDYVEDILSLERYDPATFSATGGQTEGYNSGLTLGNAYAVGAGYEVAAGASTTVEWTSTGAGTAVLCAAVIKQASGGGGGSIAPILAYYAMMRRR